MNRKRAILSMSVLFICSSIGALSASAQQFGSNELVQATKFLQDKPYDKNAPAIRAMAVNYVMVTKDVTVIVCGGDITKPFLDKKNKNSTELVAQYTIAMAAIKILNPGLTDENVVQLAALNSVLKTYEAMIKEKPKTRFEGMDEYIVKRDKGELEALVASVGCGKKS